MKEDRPLTPYSGDGPELIAARLSKLPPAKKKRPVGALESWLIGLLKRFNL